MKSEYWIGCKVDCMRWYSKRVPLYWECSALCDAADARPWWQKRRDYALWLLGRRPSRWGF
jgi:hypothetical protein